MPKVTKIAPKVQAARLLRVAAYARVSCGKDAMLHSLSAQVSQYSRLIQSHSGWQYVGVYAEMLTTTLIQMHLPAPRAESWVHLSHFRSLSRVHLGALGAHPPGSPEKRSHGVEIQRLRAREENFAITSNWRLQGTKRNR